MISNPVLAGSTTWIANNGATASWDDPVNWSNGVPSVADTAFFAPPFNSTYAAIPTGATRQVARTEFDGGVTGGRLEADVVAGGQSFVIFSELGALSGWLGIEGSFSGPLFTGPSIRGSIGDGAGGGNFGVYGGGFMYALNTYQGDTVVVGSLTMRTAGAMPNTRSVTLPFSTLDIRNASTPGDRLPDSGDLQFVGGKLNFLSPAGTSENTRDIHLTGGTSTLGLNGGTVVARSIIADPGACLVIGSIPGFGSYTPMRLLNPPSLPQVSDPTQTPILQYATFRNGGFVTYDYGPDRSDPSDDVGVRPLDTNTEYVRDSFAPDRNVWITQGAVTQASDLTVQSLILGNCDITLNNAKLTIASNAMVLQPGSSLPSTPLVHGNGAMEFPGDARILCEFNTAVIDVPVKARSLTISGTGSATQLAEGRVELTKPSDLVEGVYLNTGNLVVTNAAALGTGPVRLIGGNLGFDSVGPITVSNEIIIASGYKQGPASASALTFPSLGANFAAVAQPDVILSGHISGSGPWRTLASFTRFVGTGMSQDMDWHMTRRLQFDGTFDHTPVGRFALVVDNEGQLTGTGRIGGLLDVTDGGRLMLGSGATTLTVEDVVFEDGGILSVNLDSPPARSYTDKLIVTNSLAFDFFARLEAGVGYP
ncbi:MAG: hypothetical protein ACREJC_01360, partial [Tepidisphaeraceae bacterium]